MFSFVFLLAAPSHPRAKKWGRGLPPHSPSLALSPFLAFKVPFAIGNIQIFFCTVRLQGLLPQKAAPASLANGMLFIVVFAFAYKKSLRCVSYRLQKLVSKHTLSYLLILHFMYTFHFMPTRLRSVVPAAMASAIVPSAVVPIPALGACAALGRGCGATIGAVRAIGAIAVIRATLPAAASMLAIVASPSGALLRIVARRAIIKAVPAIGAVFPVGANCCIFLAPIACALPRCKHRYGGKPRKQQHCQQCGKYFFHFVSPFLCVAAVRPFVYRVRATLAIL